MISSSRLVRWLAKNATWLIALAALAVAISTAWFQVSNWRMQQEHNRLSVRPFLQVGRYLTPDPSRSRIGLYLTNDGVGVALLKRLHVEIHAKGITTELQAAIEQAMDESGPMAALNTLWKGRHADFPNARITASLAPALRAGESICLFGIPTELHTLEIERALYELLNEIELAITYESMYGEPSETSLVREDRPQPAS